MKALNTILFVLILSICGLSQTVTAVVNAASAQVKEQPDAKAKVVRQLRRGTRITYLETDVVNGFCLVRVGKRRAEGWVSQKSIKMLRVTLEQY